MLGVGGWLVVLGARRIDVGDIFRMKERRRKGWRSDAVVSGWRSGGGRVGCRR